jgi:hypothetical protein
MHLARSGIALDPRRFGRSRAWQVSASEMRASVSDEVKLFASTFVGGFVFVSLLLA